MSNRITGLATGLDIDELVKSTMQAYKTKVDVKKQQKTVIEIKQQLYRDVIKEGQEFYNKYFDLAKSGNLLTSNSYQSIKFTSSDEAVASATATSAAIKDNYKIDVKSMAKSASAELTSAQLSKDLEFTNSGKKVLVKVSELDGKTEKEKAKYLNAKLSSIGLKASTSDFKSGITVETIATGSEQKFTIGSGTIIDEHFVSTTDSADKTKEEFEIADLLADGAEDLKFERGDKSVTITASKMKSFVSEIDSKIAKAQEELGKLTNDADIDIKNEEIADLQKERSSVLTARISKELESIGLKAKVDGDNLVVSNANDTSTETFKYSYGKLVETEIQLEGDAKDSDPGTNLKAIISNSKGTIAYGYTGGEDDFPAGATIMEGTSNKVTLDGVVFTMNNVGTSTVSGKIDGTDLKDKLVSFVNDYNNFMTNMNKLLNQKRYRDYAPLTEEQKKEMSESEIELWDEKVKSGQLRRDGDITRIVNNLKSAMSSSVLGAGTILEKIGITPVQDYSGDKNGTFTIDEEALTKAIEEDPESIMNIFTKKGDDSSDTGILYRMKDILNDEFISTSKSALIKKAGLEGTASFTQNTLTEQITKYERKIEDMEDDLKDREQALYSKWATIETMMNNYNSQMSYLSSMFGTGS